MGQLHLQQLLLYLWVHHAHLQPSHYLWHSTRISPITWTYLKQLAKINHYHCLSLAFLFLHSSILTLLQQVLHTALLLFHLLLCTCQLLLGLLQF